MSTLINLEDYVKPGTDFALGNRRVTLKYDLTQHEQHYHDALHKIMNIQMDAVRSSAKPESDDVLTLLSNTTRHKSIKLGSGLWQHNVLYIVTITDVDVPRFIHDVNLNPVVMRLEVEFNIAILEADQ